MFLQIPLALALAATFLSLTIAATLPSYLVISVVNSTGVTIGSLTGYGNFSHPGPSYPFRSAPSNTTADYASLHGYYSCDAAAGGILACGDSSGGASESFFSSDNGNLALEGTDGTWSVSAPDDSGVGTDQFGHVIGIPVYVGSTAAIPVSLSIKAATG
ncbi:hypothetical protein LHYA1_G002092 [Lachnellula hyalina]|uniref:Uncharacterized protein n=1 Tax=Lachnellula hyalina TaxID=1316788 RepID=A0A8H8R7C4_9HELO|nr:uncharacterized protein LHYA1_G002092 [Lachnellula hyalina]TVY28875.1 hypothetical protein LHYA1_G002092 [Lachnellula hyalina]